MGHAEIEKPDCYTCKHRGTLPGNAHSKCVHPKVTETKEDPLIGLLSALGGVNLGPDSELAKKIGVRGHAYGIQNGWFNWPMNFDPVWLLDCNGHERRTKD